MQKHMLSWGSVLMVTLGLWVLMGWLSSAEAVLTIRSAAVVNGVAVVEGGNAPRAAPISWEGARVTQANNGGNFAFQGVVPADCVGRLEDGVAADAIDVALANCIPVPPPPEFPAPLPKTGQTQCWDINDMTPPIALIPCEGTRQDGDFQAGVAWPNPRFTDHGNGTVTDNLTGLIWMKDISCMNCINTDAWIEAFHVANNMASGGCGLSDGSVAGDWRMPNVREMLSLIDFGRILPALPPGHPFVFTPQSGYWTSTSRADAQGENAFMVSVDFGTIGAGIKNPDTSRSACVWPVRGPQ